MPRRKPAPAAKPRKKAAAKPELRKKAAPARKSPAKKPPARKSPAKKPPAKKPPAKKPPARSAKPRRPRKTRDWRSSISTRNEVVRALKSVAGSLVGRLKRAPLNADEVSYLRGIANLKLGKRLTQAQALAVLAASRAGSPLFRSVFGKREGDLVAAFLSRMNALALKRTRTESNIAARYPELPAGLAMQLATAQHRGHVIFYKEKGTGATQSWSVEGFRRFISNPIYKTRRKGVFGGGTFWTATRSEPRKGKVKLVVK